ncbi:MAG: metallophosphoesterase family protein [Candidatus Micrarchaeia archaeon]
MKIAIVSDTHFGYERFYEDAFIQAETAFEEANKLADAIIIPGDIFDKKNPRPEVLGRAFSIFRKLDEFEWNAKIIDYKPMENGKNIYITKPIVAIPGTHERLAVGKENAVGLLSIAGLVADTSEAFTIISKGSEKVAIYGIGGISEDMIKEKIKELNPVPLPGMFNILVFHQSIYELMPFSSDFLSKEELPKGFDLYIDGHIHNRISDTVHNKPFLISGSTVLTQLKESEQEDKGFYIFDTESKTYEFHYINSRKFKVIRIILEDADPSEVVNKLEAEISTSISSQMPILKVYLQGSIKSGFDAIDIPISSVIKKFSEKAYIEVDQSDLKSAKMEKNIENIRAGKIEDLPIKDLGMQMFVSRLKDLGYDYNIDPSAIFEILSSEDSHDSAIKKALALILSEK